MGTFRAENFDPHFVKNALELQVGKTVVKNC